jgi:hypothetical protein
MASSESAAPNGQRVEGTPGGAGELTVGQRFDRASDNAQEAWSRTRETVNDIKERLDIDGRVARNPYGMIAAALGVGYVLGGGLFSPLTARLVGLGMRMGLRLAAIPFLENELRELTETVINGSSDESSEGVERKSHRARGTNKGR